MLSKTASSHTVPTAYTPVCTRAHSGQSAIGLIPGTPYFLQQQSQGYSPGTSGSPPLMMRKPVSTVHSSHLPSNSPCCHSSSKARCKSNSKRISSCLSRRCHRLSYFFFCSFPRDFAVISPLRRYYPPRSKSFSFHAYHISFPPCITRRSSIITLSIHGIDIHAPSSLPHSSFFYLSCIPSTIFLSGWGHLVSNYTIHILCSYYRYQHQTTLSISLPESDVSERTSPPGFSPSHKSRRYRTVNPRSSML